MFRNMDQWDKALGLLSIAAFVYSGRDWLLLGAEGIPGLALELGGLALAIAFLWRQQSHAREEQRQLEEEMTDRDRMHAEEALRLRNAGRENLETFRSTLAHSLRMPIAIIQGYAELLSGDMVEDPETQMIYLGKIIQRSRDMSDIVSRQLSSVPGESMTLACSEIDLLELVRQAAADMQTAAQEQRVSIQVLSQEEHLMVEMDAFLLNRTLFNLLENSLKYMGRPGAVTIRVLEEDADTVSILVQDDGMGLSPEEVSRVFEMNYQGSNVGKKQGRGHGLFLVKRAVEAHGGTVSAQSSPGRGMRVALKLPRRQAPDKTVEPGTRKEAAIVTE